MVRRYLPVAAFSGLIVAIQLATLFTGAAYHLTQLTMTAYYSLVIVGLCMLIGYAGQISLGHAGFFAIGGYTTAFLTTLNFMAFSTNPAAGILKTLGILVSGQNLYGENILYLSPWIGCIAAVALAALAAFLIGRPVLKLKGHYLAMATLGFGVIIEKIVRGSKIFGGADGLSNVPAFGILPGLKVSGEMQDRVLNYFVAWVLVVLGILLLTNLIHSRSGRALRALHDGEEAANAMGVDTARAKLNVFIIGAVFAAIAGVFLTHFNGCIGPGEASVMKSIRYVAIVAVGGMANLWGTLVMGFLLNFLSLRGVFGTYDDAVFGAILILVMLFAPNGFIGLGVKKRNKKEHKEG